jgi:hypothetical protein
MKNFIKKLELTYTKSMYFKMHFIVLSFVTYASLLRSLLHIFLPDGGAQLIATIPLDTYSKAAQDVIIGMFALWGLAQLFGSLIFMYVLIRKPKFIMLLYVFLLFEYGGRLLIGLSKPFETVQTAPGAVGNYVLIVFSVVSLISLVFVQIKKLD